MSHRDGYKEGVPSVTDLLKWGGVYPSYPPEPTGYYLKRGHWVDQVCAILSQGQELDAQTIEAGNKARERPLSLHEYEFWCDYILPFREWLSQHIVTYIHSQGYIYNPWEGYQGTYDLLVEVDGVFTLIDFWCGASGLTKSKALQTAAYAMGIETVHMQVNDLRVRPHLDGKIRPRRLGIELEPGHLTQHPFTNHRDYEVFRVLARCRNTLKDYQ